MQLTVCGKNRVPSPLYYPSWPVLGAVLVATILEWRTNNINSNRLTQGCGFGVWGHRYHRPASVNCVFGKSKVFAEGMLQQGLSHSSFHGGCSVFGPVNLDGCLAM